MAIKKNRYRDVAQLVARMVWDHDAAGSNPVISTIKSTVPFGTVLFCFMVELTIRPAFKLCLNQVRKIALRRDSLLI